MNRELIEAAIQKCDENLLRFPGDPALRSIRAQLEYLSELASGITADKSRLPYIILGRQAAQEIEPIDMGFANILYKVDIEVDHWKASLGDDVDGRDGKGGLP